jgi:transmembrane sensor
MSSHRQDDLKITEQATEWLEIIDDATPQRRAAFIAWLKESPRHVGEFLAVAAISREFNHFDAERRIDIDALLAQNQPNVVALAQAERSEAKKASSVHREARFRKPIVGIAAAVVTVAIAVGWLLLEYSGQRYETEIGEQRSIGLPDGSLVFLNARSELTVDFSDRARDMRLLSGEALFKVARDPKRPFRVDVGSAIVQAVGTQFNINRRPQGITVSVLEGQIQLSNKVSDEMRKESNTQPDSINGGQEARITADGHVVGISTLNEAEVTAWQQRQLVFRSDRLADVAAEFNRYNHSPQIRVDGQTAQERRLTGIFDADDPESLVLFLADSDLSVRQEGSEVVITEPSD